jgi:hypothetical protein
MTETECKLMAAAAIIGLRRRPNTKKADQLAAMFTISLHSIHLLARDDVCPAEIQVRELLK